MTNIIGEGFLYEVIAFAIVGLLGGWPFLYFYQKRRKTVYLVYDISPQAEQLVQEFYTACFNLNENENLWIITDEKTHGDYKRHSGATSSVSRESLVIYTPTKRIQTNIIFPIAEGADQTIYFLPDTILYVSDNGLNAASYEDLEITLSTNSFREEESIPSDSEQVGSTWRYVNADGGPDRRFNNNYRIPILEYGGIEIEDDDGLYLKVMTSNYEIGKSFANALNRYKRSFCKGRT
jgi:hypothetical protein